MSKNSTNTAIAELNRKLLLVKGELKKADYANVREKTGMSRSTVSTCLNGRCTKAATGLKVLKAAIKVLNSNRKAVEAVAV